MLPALISAPAILFSVLVVNLGNAYLLSAPLAVKIFSVAVGLAPAGLALGMFYPFGVGQLVQRGMRETVSVTYGLATLSSVLGSAWAMTAFNNLGFTRVIFLGAGAYVLTALIYLLAPRQTS